MGDLEKLDIVAEDSEVTAWLSDTDGDIFFWGPNWLPCQSFPSDEVVGMTTENHSILDYFNEWLIHSLN
jgi:hypothetical protein